MPLTQIGRGGGTGGGVGGGLRLRNPVDEFSAVSLVAARNARDLFFLDAANASVLAQYVADPTLAIILTVTGGASVFETYQGGATYDNSQWVDRTDAVQGPPGKSIQGAYYVRAYQAASTKPSPPTASTLAAGMVTFAPSDWTNAVPTVADGERLWAVEVLVDPSADTGPSVDLTSRISIVVPFTGATGPAAPTTRLLPVPSGDSTDGGKIMKLNAAADAWELGSDLQGGVGTSEIVDGSVTHVKLAADAVESDNIADGAVGTDQIAGLAVTEGKIAANAVTRGKIKNNSIYTNKITDAQVTTAKLATDAVETDKIKDGAVTHVKLGADAVDGDNLANNAVDSEHITDGSIDTAHIADGQVTHVKLSADAVDGDNLADDAVDSEHITDGSIDTAHIADGQVTHVKLAADAVDGDNLADDAVDSEHITDGSIDTVHIADGQVTTAKLATDAVETAKIKNGAVSHDKLDTDAVEGDNIADNAVDSEHYVDGSIDTDHIADAQVTGPKLASNAISNRLGLADPAPANRGKIVRRATDGETYFWADYPTGGTGGGGTYDDTVISGRVTDLEQETEARLDTLDSIWDRDSWQSIADDTHIRCALVPDSDLAGSPDVASYTFDVNASRDEDSVVAIALVNEALTLAMFRVLVAGSSDNSRNIGYVATGWTELTNWSNVPDGYKIYRAVTPNLSRMTAGTPVTLSVQLRDFPDAVIGDGSVTHDKLANDAVDGDNIADNAIDSEHYADGSIDTAHIADGQITHVKLAADVVDGDNLADDAVDSEHITDGSIDTVHIANSQVTAAKLASTVAERLLPAPTDDTDDSGKVAALNAAGDAYELVEQSGSGDGGTTVEEYDDSAIDARLDTVEEIFDRDSWQPVANTSILSVALVPSGDLDGSEDVSDYTFARSASVVNSGLVAVALLRDGIKPSMFRVLVGGSAPANNGGRGVSGWSELTSWANVPDGFSVYRILAATLNQSGVSSPITLESQVRDFPAVPANYSDLTGDVPENAIPGTITRDTELDARITGTQVQRIPSNPPDAGRRVWSSVDGSQAWREEEGGGAAYDDSVLDARLDTLDEFWDRNSWQDLRNDDHIGGAFVVPLALLSTDYSTINTQQGATHTGSTMVRPIVLIRTGLSLNLFRAVLTGSTNDGAHNATTWVGIPNVNTVPDGFTLLTVPVNVAAATGETATLTIQVRDFPAAASSSTVADGSITHAKLANDAVEGDNIADNAVDSEHYTDGSIDTAHIADSQVTASKLATDSVETAKIKDGAVTHTKLGGDAVDGDNLADDAVDSEHITDGSIDTVHIADGQITHVKLAADAVDGDNLADNAVDSEHITDGSIDTDHIANSQVTATKLATDSVETAKIKDGAVTHVKLATDAVDGDNLADDAVDSEHITDGSIDTVHIDDGQVTHAKLANDAVEGDNLADNAVDSEHYTDGSIDTDHIANSQVTAAKLATDSVETGKIKDGAVTHVKLAADAVDGDNLADDAVDSEHITDGSIDTAHIANSQVTAAKLADTVAERLLPAPTDASADEGKVAALNAAGDAYELIEQSGGEIEEQPFLELIGETTSEVSVSWVDTGIAMPSSIESDEIWAVEILNDLTLFRPQKLLQETELGFIDAHAIAGNSITVTDEPSYLQLDITLLSAQTLDAKTWLGMSGVSVLGGFNYGGNLMMLQTHTPLASGVKFYRVNTSVQVVTESGDSDGDGGGYDADIITIQLTAAGITAFHKFDAGDSLYISDSSVDSEARILHLSIEGSIARIAVESHDWSQYTGTISLYTGATRNNANFFAALTVANEQSSLADVDTAGEWYREDEVPAAGRDTYDLIADGERGTRDALEVLAGKTAPIRDHTATLTYSTPQNAQIAVSSSIGDNAGVGTVAGLSWGSSPRRLSGDASYKVFARVPSNELLHNIQVDRLHSGHAIQRLTGFRDLGISGGHRYYAWTQGQSRYSTVYMQGGESARLQGTATTTVTEPEWGGRLDEERVRDALEARTVRVTATNDGSNTTHDLVLNELSLMSVPTVVRDSQRVIALPDGYALRALMGRTGDDLYEWTMTEPGGIPTYTSPELRGARTARNYFLLIEAV